jgi:glyoxylase-like metal-dependent hydrolase (beta-lactamase superfamily II)
MTLAAGLDYVDLEFLGHPAIIATGILHGRQGAALVDPGPSTTLPVLMKALGDRGFDPTDVRMILLTHIHLDHAGATGSLAEICPHAEVVVHERGAPHVADPAKLIASAARLYGDDMERLWGEIRAVPEARLHVVGDAARLHVVGHDVEVAWTPGHASHHVSYFLPENRLAFTGDPAGMCRPSGRLVVPPTPPPDIDLEAWRRSTDRILAWEPETLFLTHFGPHPAPRVHVQELWQRLEDWSRRVRASLDGPETDEEKAQLFSTAVMEDLTRSANRKEAESYERAGRFDYSWSGLARYWRKGAAASHE